MEKEVDTKQVVAASEHEDQCSAAPCAEREGAHRVEGRSCGRQR